MSDAIVKITSDGRTAILCGEIEILAASEIMHWVAEQNIAKKHKNLDLIINSRGGSVGNSFAIIDSITGSDIPVYTYATGLLASGALAIFISGNYRVLHENANVMSHQPWDSVEGRELEFEAIGDSRRLCKERILKHYARCTGLKSKEVEKELFSHKDRYIDGDTALKLGLCDIVKDCGYFINKKRKK